MTVYVHSDAAPSGAVAVRLTAAEAEVIRKIGSLGEVAGLTVYAVARPEDR